MTDDDFALDSDNDDAFDDDDEDDEDDIEPEPIKEIDKKLWALQPGHGKKDVSCHHGSRWIWWPGEDGKGEWMNVVLSSRCNCATPPRPDNVPAKPTEARIIPFDSSHYHKMEEYLIKDNNGERET